jgi:stearoyl-CoA desaturase (delta-9 desaturase)
MYGIVKEYLRIPDNKFKQRGNYFYVEHGFFDVQNVFRPLPLGVAWTFGHILYIYGVYRVLSQQLWLSWIVNFWYGTWGGLSVTGGNHRLWCHRSYDAKLPLRIFLMLGQTMTGQYTVGSWSVGHRVHHKYSDEDADPHNTKRGFFFAHAGWLFRKEHPLVSLKERLYDYSDLDRDSVLVFQHKYYYYLWLIMSVFLPMSLQVLLAGDCLLDAFLLSVVMRNMSVYHDTAFVNSAAHMFGDRPYNETIDPRENYYVSLASFGEGYHNYHHSYPWDYKAGETGAGFNFTSVFIEIMHFFGQAYNLKVASKEVIEGGRDKVIQRKEILLKESTKKVTNSTHISKPSLREVVLPAPESITSWAREVFKTRMQEGSCEFL